MTEEKTNSEYALWIWTMYMKLAEMFAFLMPFVRIICLNWSEYSVLHTYSFITLHRYRYSSIRTFFCSSFIRKSWLFYAFWHFDAHPVVSSIEIREQALAAWWSSAANAYKNILTFHSLQLYILPYLVVKELLCLFVNIDAKRYFNLMHFILRFIHLPLPFVCSFCLSTLISTLAFCFSTV